MLPCILYRNLYLIIARLCFYLCLFGGGLPRWPLVPSPFLGVPFGLWSQVLSRGGGYPYELDRGVIKVFVHIVSHVLSNQNFSNENNDHGG